jgi:type I restriction enzyme, R subunit
LRFFSRAYLHWPDIAQDGTNPLRDSYGDVIIKSHLEAAISRINQRLPYSLIEDVVQKVVRTENPGLADNNRSFHKLLTDGVPIDYTDKDGRLIHDQAWLIDFHNPENNHWMAINQFTVVEENHNRRPDIVVFINGLPLAVIELKDAKNEKATIKTGYKQFQTYKSEIPSLFRFNEALLVSDGIHARIGTLTAGWDRFTPWRTVHGVDVASKT